jgi:ech hydrogenase subunit E
VRDKLLDIVEETTGGRVIFGSAKIGGVRRDIDPLTMKRVEAELKTIENQSRQITDVFKKDGSVIRRTKGVGVLSKEDAIALGAVGPTVRGSGIASDMRKLGYAAYAKINWEPVVENGCDCYARCMVRCRELYTSFDMIYQAMAKIPEGPIDVKVTGNPTGDYFARVEQPRGEVIYYVKGNGSKNLERFRVRTPTFANVPPLVKMLGGCELADVPVIVLTIDPCISCTER